MYVVQGPGASHTVFLSLLQQEMVTKTRQTIIWGNVGLASLHAYICITRPRWFERKVNPQSVDSVRGSADVKEIYCLNMAGICRAPAAMAKTQTWFGTYNVFFSKQWYQFDSGSSKTCLNAVTRIIYAHIFLPGLYPASTKQLLT